MFDCIKIFTLPTNNETRYLIKYLFLIILQLSLYGFKLWWQRTPPIFNVNMSDLFTEYVKKGSTMRKYKILRYPFWNVFLLSLKKFTFMRLIKTSTYFLGRRCTRSIASSYVANERFMQFIRVASGWWKHLLFEM